MFIRPCQLVNVASEMTKPVLPVEPPRGIGRELPDDRDNEIIIELDRENQYSRTQPRANEPQGNHLRHIQPPLLTSVIYTSTANPLIPILENVYYFSI